MPRFWCLVVLLSLVLRAAATDAGSGETNFPSASAWRVVNAQSVSDHWKIGELVMLDAAGDSTAPLIRSVICSYNYDEQTACSDEHDLDKVYDGVWSTDGGRGCWAGSTDEREAQACGSWLGFEFERPVTIHSVNMAQADYLGVTRVTSVSLEARVNEEWQHVTNVHFSSCVTDFVGRVGAPVEAQTQCAAVDTSVSASVIVEDEEDCEYQGEFYEDEDSPSWPAFVFPVVLLGLLWAGCTKARRAFKKTPPQSNVSGAAGRPAANTPQAQAVAIPMQQPMAVAVAAAMPVQQPAANTVMVTCPPGAKAGDRLQVAGPGGQMMQVPVPAGVRAGGQFMVQMPAAPVVTTTDGATNTDDTEIVMGTVVEA